MNVARVSIRSWDCSITVVVVDCVCVFLKKNKRGHVRKCVRARILRDFAYGLICVHWRTRMRVCEMRMSAILYQHGGESRRHESIVRFFERFPIQARFR